MVATQYLIQELKVKNKKQYFFVNSLMFLLMFLFIIILHCYQCLSNQKISHESVQYVEMEHTDTYLRLDISIRPHNESYQEINNHHAHIRTCCLTALQ